MREGDKVIARVTHFRQVASLRRASARATSIGMRLCHVDASGTLTDLDADLVSPGAYTSDYVVQAKGRNELLVTYPAIHHLDRRLVFDWITRE